MQLTFAVGNIGSYPSLFSQYCSLEHHPALLWHWLKYFISLSAERATPALHLFSFEPLLLTYRHSKLYFTKRIGFSKEVYFFHDVSKYNLVSKQYYNVEESLVFLYVIEG